MWRQRKNQMRKTITLFALAAICATANAKVLTVSNNSNSPGQYTSVQTAITAAVAGDTIYVHGSVTSYGAITLNKRLVLIGAGYKPTGTQYNLPTVIDYVYLNQSTSSSLPTGSIIKGIAVISISGSGETASSVNNITLERNFISSNLSVAGKGWIIKNNMIGSVAVGYNENIIISNNIIGSGNYGIATSNKPSVIICNNVFLKNNYMTDVSYAIIANNFFIEPTTLNYFSGTQNTWNKNIFLYGDETNYKIFPLAGNTGVGNLNTTDPQFVSAIPLDVTMANARTYDWNLLSTSLGKTYGTDGSDIGFYGGSYPMPNLTGAVNMPQIVSVDIQNSVIPLNGTLNVEIKARSQK